MQKVGLMTDPNILLTARRIVELPTEPTSEERRRKKRSDDILERHAGTPIYAIDLWAAACAGQAPYFDEQGTSEHDDIFQRRFRRAQQLCATCPVINECYEKVQALPSGQQRGIWAGKAYGNHPQEKAYANQ